MNVEIKEFGTYFVMRDTAAPTIKAINFDKEVKVQKDFSAMKSIQLKIGDNLSGIQFYSGTIDGKWVLFEYDPKKDMLKYTFDDSITKGSHELKVTVIDKCGNERKYVKEFVR